MEKTKTEELLEDHMVKTELRPYLGISSIADSCDRKLWYQFRFCKIEEITPRLERLFGRGNREEDIVIADLEKIGVLVYGRQNGYTLGHGHIKGHCDGVLKNVPDDPDVDFLFECKTASNKNFKKFKKEKYSKNDVYYGQVVCYMELEGLSKCLVVIVNKDTDEREYKVVRSNHKHAEELFKKGENVISSEAPLQKIGNQDWYECKWCKFYDICHFNAPVLKTCRTCQHCDICENGVWQCSKFDNIELTTSQQIKACKHYNLLEVLK